MSSEPVTSKTARTGTRDAILQETRTKRSNSHSSPENRNYLNALHPSACILLPARHSLCTFGPFFLCLPPGDSGQQATVQLVQGRSRPLLRLFRRCSLPRNMARGDQQMIRTRLPEASREGQLTDHVSTQGTWTERLITQKQTNLAACSARSR